jgi:ABC-type transport system involved in cytochrome c biogenesis permease component
VHWLVDSAIAFLVMAFVALLLGVAIWWIVVVALLIGLPAAPWTRGAEERALARRDPPDA